MTLVLAEVAENTNSVVESSIMKSKENGNFIQRHYKKIRQISALVGIVLLVLIYIVALIAAFISSPSANGLFMASLYCTLIIPCLIYGFQLICKVFGGPIAEINDNKNLTEKDDKNDDKNDN